MEMAESVSRIEAGLSQHAQQESALASLEREVLQRANEAVRPHPNANPNPNPNANPNLNPNLMLTLTLTPSLTPSLTPFLTSTLTLTLTLTLTPTRTQVRKEMQDQTFVQEQKLRAAEDALRESRVRTEELSTEVEVLAAGLAKAEGVAAAATKEAETLTRELDTANERLTAMQGKQTLSEVAVADSAIMAKNLAGARTEVDALKTQLAAARQHGDRFKELSEATENTLKELQARQAATSESHQSEVLSRTLTLTLTLTLSLT